MNRYSFPIMSETEFDPENGYALFSALCKIKRLNLHGSRKIHVEPLRKTSAVKDSHLRRTVPKVSSLNLRGLTPEQAQDLSMSWVSVNGQTLILGKAIYRDLPYAPTVVSRAVAIDHSTEQDFKNRAEAALIQRGYTYSSLSVGRRRVMKFGRNTRGQDRFSVTYALQIEGLDVPSYYDLMTTGLGRWKRTGCGVFSPVYPGTN